MATRHTLGVAASTLALAASCLVGALPASASTSATFPASVSIAAAPSASALPTDAEIQEAKKNKDSTNAMIARIEASLASSRAELQRVETEAAEAQESLLSAGEERDLRTAEAEKAVKQLDYAKTYLAQSRKDLGAIASDIYRNGAGTSTLGLLLDDNKEGDLFYKAATIDALSEQQVQSVNTAAEAEALVSAWQEYADAAQSAAEEAAANYDSAAATANSTLNTYESAVEPEKKLRNELIGHLATLQQKEEAEVRKAVEKKEAKEQEAALEEAIATEDTTEVPEEKPAAVQPLAVAEPQELEPTDSEDEPTVKPKAVELDTLTPTAMPEPPKAEPTKTPEPQPTKTAEPTPEPTKTAEPKPTKTAEPKPTKTAEPKPTKTAEPKPTKTAEPKPTPKPTPKPEPTKTAEPEPEPQPDTGRSYSAAIAWALKTADDPSKYYVYGGNGPNAFDCSSFSQRAFSQSGISLPRTSTQQFFSAPQYVSLSNLRPGDLVFSSSNGGSSFYHVAIYIGNGNVVHARNPNAGISVTPLSWVNNLYSKAARY
ncbi:NlpC/P60 family protein [Glutamicibacter sp. JL.03c]|uniref:C40 family peptidase n=1 Tax=Glutamicibacter sp. JL.03c TaxID=2984842 RepID=UPI0021F77ABE|nr:NlpC/P60 family protein [Glutamicibacter sp. JL.03c]UYQ77815.1 NlpC/P60 family protein [Glutamicibacter sp. JL.03c]